MSEEEKVDEGAAAETSPESEAPAAEAEETPVAETEETVADGETPAGSGEEEAPAEATGESAAGSGGATDVRQAEFQPIHPEETIASGNNLDLIMDVTVPVTIDLGGTVMPLKDVLALGPGSVVKLDRPLGEPVDIKVNGELVGRGEVVVVDDQFGVQVTELNKSVTVAS